MTGPRTRRSLLRVGALALAGGVAGCVGSLGDDTADSGMPTQTTTDTRTPTTRTTTDTDDTETTTNHDPPLAVVSVSVQSSFFHLTTPDSADVTAPAGSQFVFADVRPTDSTMLAPSADAISLAADDRRFDATTELDSTYDVYHLYRQVSTYNLDDRDTGWVAFDVPEPLDADEVALTYKSAGVTFSESLDEEAVEALSEPPAEFELVGVDAPESVESDRSFEISVTVENTSDADGTFRAVLNQSQPSYSPHPVEVAVPAGERREWTDTFGHNLYGTNAERANYTFVSPIGDREVTVEVSE